MERRKYVSIIVSTVFLLASVAFSYVTFSGNADLQTILTRASGTTGLTCPTGTSLLFPQATTLAVNSLVGAGGKVLSVKTGSTPWTVALRSGALLAENGTMITIGFTKQVLLDSVLIYDNDHDPGWTINNINLTRTANNTPAPVMKLGLTTDAMTFNGNGDSVHFNVCVADTPTSTPTKTPTKTPTPIKTATPSATGTIKPTCIPYPICAIPGANPVCDLPNPPVGGSYCPQPTATKTPTPTIKPTCVPVPVCVSTSGTPCPLPTLSSGGSYCPVTPTKTPTPSSGVPQLCTLNADIVIILDRSGSMNSKESDGRTKLDWAKEAAINLVKALEAKSGVNSRVSIVSFGAQGNDGKGKMSSDRNSTLHISLSSDWAAVKAAIESVVVTADGTCLECGIRIANEQLVTKTKNRVGILLSDGRGNHLWDGTSTTVDANPAALAEAVKGRQAGIDYYVLGFGSSKSIDEVTLKAIASEADHYQYKPLTADWSEAFLNILKQVCTEITPTPPLCVPPSKVKNIKITCPNCAQ